LILSISVASQTRRQAQAAPSSKLIWAPANKPIGQQRPNFFFTGGDDKILTWESCISSPPQLEI
jgi:hypothetical protein